MLKRLDIFQRDLVHRLGGAVVVSVDEDLQVGDSRSNVLANGLAPTRQGALEEGG